MMQPPTGGHAPPFACSRLLRWPDDASRCPNGARWHVIWNSECDNGLCCDEHANEARESWVYVGMHSYEMACSMPGAVYLWDENRCVVAEDVRSFARLTAAQSGRADG